MDNLGHLEFVGVFPFFMKQMPQIVKQSVNY